MPEFLDLAGSRILADDESDLLRLLALAAIELDGQARAPVLDDLDRGNRADVAVDQSGALVLLPAVAGELDPVAGRKLLLAGRGLERVILAEVAAGFVQLRGRAGSASPRQRCCSRT